MIPIKFLDDLVHLKVVPRSGWISYKINRHDVEPVSSHSYSVAMIALTISEIMRSNNRSLDVEQVLRMALLHDLSESLTFDISKAYLRYLGRGGSRLKEHIERKAVSHILAGLRNEQLNREFRTTLEEYQTSKSLEARIVHCADALDLLLQVIEYQKMGYSRITMDPIWKETRAKLASYRLALADEWSTELERVRKGLHRRPRRAE